jgi:putative GTP pyrophosphokinase
MTKDEIIQQVLREYDTKQSLYSAFTSKQQLLISELLQERSFSPHSVTSRVKSRKSLEDKLRRTDSNYAQLSDVTDLAGVRITTYFSDEVDRMGAHLEKEFDIVKEHSIDKRKTMDADRFGYLSLHYVVKLSDSRLKLTEYRRFPNLACEIQIRSILQHAWAEIEHDLGYKARLAVPQFLRRRFSRLAGLLELADEEFVTIRDELSGYSEKLPEEIRQTPADVTLDKLSLAEFLKSNQTAGRLDQELASYFGAELEREPEIVENDLTLVNFFGIRTVSELESALKQNEKMIRAFAKRWVGNSKETSIGRGICLLYLCYVLVGQSGSTEYALRFLAEGNIGGEHENSAKKIFQVYSAVNVP